MSFFLHNFLKDTWTKLLAGVIGLHVVFNSIWLFLDKAPIGWDPASHTWLAIQIATKLKEYNFYQWLRASNYYPIFVHTLVGIFITLTGVHVGLIQFFGTIFLIGSLASIYVYFSGIFTSKASGFFASALFSLFPVVYNQSHFLMLDIALTTMLFATLSLLEKTHNFTHKNYTVSFFICAGLLLMTKWTGGVFLMVPLLFTLWKVYKVKKYKTIWPHVGIGLVAFGIIVLPWYILNLKDFLFLSKINSLPDGNDPTNLISFDNIFYYLKSLVNDQITFIPFIVFLGSLVVFIRSHSPKRLLIFTQLVVGYSVLTIIGNKDPRYSMPLLPYVAALIGFMLIKLQKKFRLALASVIFIPLLLYYFVLNFGFPAFNGVRLSIPVPVLGSVTLMNTSEDIVKKVNQSVWPDEQIIQDIGINAKGQKSQVIVAYDNEHLNPSVLSMYTIKANYNKEFTNITIQTPYAAFLTQAYGKNEFPNMSEIYSYINKYQYLLISPNSTGYPFLRNGIALEQLRYVVFPDKFPTCREFLIKVAHPKTTCFVNMGDILTTGSDVVLNDELSAQKHPQITGFAKVYCKWGCSFGAKQLTGVKPPYALQPIKLYHLPNQESLYLYRINTL